MNDKALIDKEIARIKAGPQKGYFSFLHHEGPIIEWSENVMERVDFILLNKNPSEIYTRLRHIYYVPETYQEAIATAGKAYQEAIATAEKVILALIPNCTWDGKSIFGKEIQDGN